MRCAGFPEGNASLERPARWYDERWTQELSGVEAVPVWSQYSHLAWLWLPALALAEPPVLDLGCGPGHVAGICEHYGIAYAAGVDSSSAALERARAVYPNSKFVLGVLPGALSAPACPAYRTALALEVLEHVFDDLGVLHALRPGSRVVVSVPNFETEGHCRWFGTAREVSDRYGPLLDITKIAVHTEGEHSWWLFGGVRRVGV